MEIVCPNCATAYRLGEAAIGPQGRKVRCARCGQEWMAARAFAEPAMQYAVLPPGTDAALTAAFADALFDGETGTPAAGHVRPRPPRAPRRREEMPEAEEADEAAAQSSAVALPAPPPAVPVTIAAVGPGFERIRKTAAAAARAPRRRPARRPLAERLGAPVLTLVLVLVAGAALARQPIVAAIPDLAGLYAMLGLDVNLRGLEFRNMTATRDIENGRPVLIVKGEIANIASRDAAVPPIRLALRSNRQEIYAWSVESARRNLAAGESVAFSTRLPTPPATADDIVLRFTGRPQLAAGTN